jgi:predicted enzyme related to lactoylglutathione lyase
MDKARFTFIDDDHFKTQWTWYENGSEQWMEDLTCTRVKGGGDATRSPVADDIGFNGGLTCVVPVEDPAAAERWYLETLGFTRLFAMEDGSFIELHSPVDRVTIGLGRSDGAGADGVTLTFGVKDIDHARRMIEAKGVAFTGPTEEIPGVVRLATFADPDGNRIMLYQSLGNAAN